MTLGWCKTHILCAISLERWMYSDFICVYAIKYLRIKVTTITFPGDATLKSRESCMQVLQWLSGSKSHGK